MTANPPCHDLLPEDLLAYADDELRGAHREWVEAVLAASPACRHRLGALDATARLLRAGTPLHDRPADRAALRARLASITPPHRRALSTLRAPRPHPTLSAAALPLLLLVALLTTFTSGLPLLPAAPHPYDAALPLVPEGLGNGPETALVDPASAGRRGHATRFAVTYATSAVSGQAAFGPTVAATVSSAALGVRACTSSAPYGRPNAASGPLGADAPGSVQGFLANCASASGSTREPFATYGAIPFFLTSLRASLASLTWQQPYSWQQPYGLGCAAPLLGQLAQSQPSFHVPPGYPPLCL